MFHAHRLTFVQSKKERDANELILRMKQMHNSLPGWMKEWSPMDTTFCYANFKAAKSRIFAIPSGADQIRGYQPSGVLSDESSYQTDVDKMIATIRPAIRSGGRLTMVSSAAPSYFSGMVNDDLN